MVDGEWWMVDGGMDDIAVSIYIDIHKDMDIYLKKVALIANWSWRDIYMRGPSWPMGAHVWARNTLGKLGPIMANQPIGGAQV